MKTLICLFLLVVSVQAQYSEDQFLQLMQMLQSQGQVQGGGYGNPGSATSQDQAFLNSLQPLLQLQQDARVQAQQEHARKNRELTSLGLSPLETGFTGDALQDNLIMMRNAQTMEGNIAEMEARGRKGDRQAAQWALQERRNQRMAAASMQQSSRWQQNHEAKVKADADHSRELIELGREAEHKSRMSSRCMDGIERVSGSVAYRQRLAECSQAAQEAEQAQRDFQAK